MELINAMDEETSEMPLSEQTDFVIKKSGLYEMYKQEKGEKGEVRIENLEELVTATKQFTPPEEVEELTPLTIFLTHASLEAGEAQASPHQEYVELMTLHSAKGLEFPRVFMVGVEEGIFPSGMSFDEGRLQEERRLAYVGMNFVAFTVRKNAIFHRVLLLNCQKKISEKFAYVAILTVRQILAPLQNIRQKRPLPF